MRSSTEFEDQYLDVLQNIEFALVETYKEYDKMSDYDAEKAVSSLIETYRAKDQGIEAPSLRLHLERQKAAYDFVKEMCEMRLNADFPFEKDGQSPDFEIEPLEINEIIACLKRIRKSIRLWNKEGGRRGYFNFVSQYLK